MKTITKDYCYRCTDPYSDKQPKMAMQTVTEHIRDHLWQRVDPPDRPGLPELQRTEWSTEFERYMRNRLLVGAYRYTPLADTETQWDFIRSIIRRAELYRQDGNQEHLVDIANCALVEFVKGCCHPAPHFSATDDGEEHVKLKE